MDLYEALKAGTSAEELKETFFKDLEAAMTRFDEEEAAAAQAKYEEDLEEARIDVAYALADYYNLLLKDTENFFITPEEIDEVLKETENPLKQSTGNMLSLLSLLQSTEAAAPAPREEKIKSSMTDDEIIQTFLQSFITSNC